MEISIPVKIELESSTLEDHTEKYKQAIKEDERVIWTKGMRMQSNNQIFQRTGDDLFPPVYKTNNPSNPQDPDLIDPAKVNAGDVFYAPPGTPSGYVDAQGSPKTVEGIVQAIGRLGHPVPLQPELYGYATHDNDFNDYTGWSQRYSKILTGISKTAPFIGFVKDSTTSGKHSIRHRLYKDSSSPTGWTYAISEYTDATVYWSNAEYGVRDNLTPTTPRYYIRVKINDQAHPNVGPFDVIGYWEDVKVIGVTENKPVEPYKTVFVSSGGDRYMVDALEREQLDDKTGGGYWYFRIRKEKTRGEVTVASDHAHVYTHVDPTTIETTSYCTLSSNCKNNFILRTFFLRGTDLYARTENNVPRETTTSTSPVLEEVPTLADFLKGWTYVSPTAKYIPFDGKTYTSIEAAGRVEFKVNVPFEDYNTVALSGLIAEKVTIEFGAGTATISDYEPDNRRDKDYRLPDYQTTTVLYVPNNMVIPAKKDNFFKVILEGKSIRLGSILGGLSVNAGFTNLTFTNKYIDYSPYEKDQWGNVTYVKGLKVNVYSGTVDVPIHEYDMMNRLMMSLAASEVILNGSDSTDNTPPNNEKSIFSATMMVGRIKDFQLATKLDNKHLGEMAQYKFTIEESV